MKRCPFCDWPNTDDADKCCNCRHYLDVKSDTKEDYALRDFLLNNERLFAVMGVFLVIAVFFNNPSVLNFSNPTTYSVSNFTIQTECKNPNFDLYYLETTNASPDYQILRSTNNSSYSSNTISESPPVILNCTSNLSSNDIINTQNQPTNVKVTDFFAFLSLVLFLVISAVVLINAFSYIRIYDLSKNIDKKGATIQLLKDLTIFLFIIPFFFLLIFFVAISSSAYGEFFSSGFLLVSIIIYVSEIIVVMYLMLRYLFSLKGNRTKEIRFAWICLAIGLGSGAFFWFIVPETLNFTFSISLAFVLIAFITFFRPSLEK